MLQSLDDTVYAICLLIVVLITLYYMTKDTKHSKDNVTKVIWDDSPRSRRLICGIYRR